MLGCGQDEGLFGTGAEDLVDAGELVAEFEIVDVALDGGQSGLERGLEGDDGGGHEARVYSSFDKARKKCTMSQKKMQIEPIKIQSAVLKSEISSSPLSS